MIGKVCRRVTDTRRLLGYLFTDGFNRNFLDPIVVGLVACLVLAVVFDSVIVVVAQVLTPWQTTTRARA